MIFFSTASFYDRFVWILNVFIIFIESSTHTD